MFNRVKMSIFKNIDTQICMYTNTHNKTKLYLWLLGDTAFYNNI